jgi:hypothetical protein
MTEIKFRVTGWKAVIVLIAVAAFLGYRYNALRTTLATEAADELRFWLAAEYMAQGLPTLEEALERGDEAAAELQAREIVARDRIEFPQLSARGDPEDVVVRAEILVDGGTPPDGRSVRYFRMRHSMVTGWRMRYEAHAVSYYLKFF